MNAATGVAFGLAAVFALGNWIAKLRPATARSGSALEYFCKPATLVALIFAAGALDPAADAHTRRAWFVAALIFSLAGDVLLMLPQDLFVPGLAAFLVGHLCYVAGFWTRGPSAVALAVAAAVVVVVVVPLGRRILTAIALTENPPNSPQQLAGKTFPTNDLPANCWGSLGGLGGLGVAVAGYMVVISAMLATALATGNVVAGVGAVLFVGSDSMIAWDRFVRPFAWAPLAIMVTYQLGQAGLVASLLR